ncbi:two-component system activity regulator YycH [Atopobacter phocae]|uniref:two-component system activity regulator YycH n=1 Tax=Atopobacter phocae TaxID=136492 RepID=UPI00047165D9|nr:two-component system activity regulator YycH [Atopobacter phocae]
MRKHISTIVLIILVISSLVLAFLNLWPPSIDLSDEDVTRKNEVITLKNQINEEMIFSPSQVVRQSDGLSMIHNQPQLIVAMMNTLGESITNVSKIDPLPQTITSISDLLFFFDTEIPLKNSGILQPSKDKELDSIWVNVIVLDRNNLGQVYLLNTLKNTWYVGTIDENIHDELLRLADRDKGIPSQYFQLKHGPKFLPYGKVSLQPHTFLVEVPGTDNYLNLLFSETSDINTRATEDLLQYSDSRSELRFDLKNSRAHFRRNIVTNNSEPINPAEEAYHLVRQFENWRYIVRLSETDIEKNTFIFRRYYQGQPILGKPDRGYLKVGLTGNGLRELDLPWRGFQLELDKQAPIELMSGAEIIGELQVGKIEMTQMEDLVIAWTPSLSEENSKVIILTPEWYVKIGGKWRPTRELLHRDLLEEDEDGF